MSKIVQPQIFLIGESTALRDGPNGLDALLSHLGAPTWESDAGTDAELLTEVYGRSCYLSFGTKLNPNLTQVRQTNRSYVDNVVSKGDGSVLEHVMTNWFFADVSRVFTAELCRHRVGTAISEQSLRFVRLTDMNWYAPTTVLEDHRLMTVFSKSFEALSTLQRELADIMNLDAVGFEQKKKLTSMMRRLAPMGLATNIGWSSNIRNLRHVIEMRTAPEAEEEIRRVFGMVAGIASSRWPNLFSDYHVDIVDDLPWYRTAQRKV